MSDKADMLGIIDEDLQELLYVVNALGIDEDKFINVLVRIMKQDITNTATDKLFMIYINDVNEVQDENYKNMMSVDHFGVKGTNTIQPMIDCGEEGINKLRKKSRKIFNR